MPKETRIAAPSSAATIRFTSSSAISKSIRAKSETAKISCIAWDYTIGLVAHGSGTEDCPASPASREGEPGGRGGSRKDAPARYTDRKDHASRRVRQPGHYGSGGAQDHAGQQRPGGTRNRPGRGTRRVRKRRAPSGICAASVHEADGLPLLRTGERGQLGALPYRGRR